MKATRPIEIEIKLPVSGAADARRMLRAAGFGVHRRRVFEDNTLFDTPDSALRKSGGILRLRQAGREATVTYKGRQMPEGRHKSREEWEAGVSDGRAMREILGRIGLRPAFRYQKYRSEYKQPGKSGVATVDETPIGVYLELEGRPAWIDRTARRLGFGEEDYVTESYPGLYMEWCKAKGIDPGDMVF